MNSITCVWKMSVGTIPIMLLYSYVISICEFFWILIDGYGQAYKEVSRKWEWSGRKIR